MENIERQKAEILEKLLQSMRTRKISVAETARALGANRSYLYRCINGQRFPSFQLLHDWAQLYNLDLSADLKLTRKG